MLDTTNPRYSFEEAIANMFSNPKYASTYLFYAHVLGQCSVIFKDDLPAAAGVRFQTDHYVLCINPEGPINPETNKREGGFNDTPLEHRLGILKHEMLHILNGHIARKEDRDHNTFNYATDCAINQLITRSHLPDYVIYPDNLLGGKPCPENLTAEQYYELISKELGDKDNQPEGGPGKPGSGTPQGRLVDDHDIWNESTGDSELQDDITKNMIEKSVTATQKSRGNIPSEMASWLDMFTHKREVDWRQVLRGIVGNKRVGSRKTLMRRDRRLPNFEWIKGSTKDRLFSLLVISDVSGSVSDSALLDLWGEVRFICDITQSAVDLIQVDTNPSIPEQLAKNTKIIQRKACGGTNLHPALDMAKKHKLDFNALVVTTDGYLSSFDVEKFATLRVPVIWLIENQGQIMPEMLENGMRAFMLKA